MMQLRMIQRLAIALGLWIGLALTSLPTLAQSSVTIRGRVLEEDKSPLPNANVRLMRGDKLQSGMATTAEGRYTLSGVPYGTYTLEISYVGYTSHRETITVGSGETSKRMADVVLREDGKLLDDVVISAKATEVVVRGDTIEYNADSFRTSQGSALEELIKRLPGAEIDEQGNITINGKSITQITIDGKRFFESDPKVAVKNLPAELIDKVQVLDRQSDAARMTGFADGDDETIINLSIKPGRKQGLFGTAYVGGGTKERYEANGLVNRFTDGKQWTILGGANNTNNAGFSDIASDLSQSDIAQQASGSRRRPWQRNDSNDGITASRILGGNLALTLSTKTEIAGNAFVGNSDKEAITRSETTNLQTSGNTHESSEVAEHNRKTNVGTALRLEWKPNPMTELVVSPQLSYGTGHGIYRSESTNALESTGALITSSKLHQDLESRVFSGGVHADFSRRLGERGRTLAVSLDVRTNSNDADGTYTNNIYTASTASSDLIHQQLKSDTDSRSVRTRLSWVEPLSGSLFLQGLYQLRAEYSTSERKAYDPDASGAYTLLNDGASYSLGSTFLSHRAGLALKLKGQSYDITAGLNVDPSSLASETTRQGNTRRITQSVVNFSPTLRLSYKPNRAFTARLDYRGRSFQPTPSQLAPVQDTSNPLIVYVGNEDLQPGYQHNIFGNISIFSSERQSSANIFGMLRFVQNEIVSTSTYDLSTGVRTIGYTNVNGSWVASLGGFYTTPLPGKRLSLRLGSRNALTNRVGFVGGERNNALALSLSEDLTLSYRHGWLDTNLKGSWTYYNATNSLASVSNQATTDYGLGWDLNLNLPLGITLESQLSYTKTEGYASGYNQEQTLLNMGLSYSFLRGKAATLRLKVYDALGEKRNVFRNVTALAISSQETNVLGQYAMLHLIYRFNSFSGNASASDMRSTSTRGPGGPPPGRF